MLGDVNLRDWDACSDIYCRRCLEPVFRPGQKLDEDGICLPCRYADSFDQIDWAARKHQLHQIAENAKRQSVGPYDCLIGVSGGKDSLRQALVVRDQLGLRPLLLCCSYPPEQATERGARNLSNLVRKGFDLQFVSPSPTTWKEMMRIGFTMHAQWTRSTELALFCSVVKTAVTMRIPLVILGENPALAFGARTGSSGSDAEGFRQYDTLAGSGIDYWQDQGIPRNKLIWYDIPDTDVCRDLGLQMIYLGYFMKDFNDIANTDHARKHGFFPREGKDAEPSYTGSLNPYESVDEDFVHVNQYLKSVKLGFGKVIQQVSVQIRYGTITREQGIGLVLKYDGKIAPELIDAFCAYLEISREEFQKVEDRIRNKNIWRLNNEAEWEHKYLPRQDDGGQT
ncbi:MAG: N-acetyl sugar amidotransferase [Alphaproteobacteria bacterium]|nr:N-acetyl sugar amidotransferase [Alphaproteobacteria bacterium]